VGWLSKLKERWKLNSLFQVVIVLVVFACTGFTVMFLKNPLLKALHIGEDYALIASVLYYVLILPIYQLVLLLYALIFGQFRFFWAFEKKMFSRIFRNKKGQD
jgi:hypothetical protein